MAMATITILGINGHASRAVATAFFKRGWRVIGFGRSNKHPMEGVEFFSGDAGNVEDMAAAIRDADLVFNGLNLPYHQWGNGAAEGLIARVIEACGKTGKTLLFPGNIYNYAPTDRVITPDLCQTPQTERGRIRVAMEARLAEAAARGDIRVIILRAGNFYGSDMNGGFFDELILRELDKGKVCLNPARNVKNAWAYLPDLGEAFAILAERRAEFGPFENFHFKGHLKTADETFAAVQAVVPNKLIQTGYPWLMLKAMGVFMPIIRGLVEMRYIWDYELGLKDPRLDAILGENFGTPYEEAIANVVRQASATERKAA
ncbi:NAD-dependent epimerase/dehydratase family protein [Pelagibacterium limicola]|uniref:NAD-dependent epimerase/dehydratase family protein n=1 Tax=Pelagibacterium limicola TaxID=2791022 RepID=UPI0018AFCE4F|nr:NAD-dependent epimerase/dehydratase family protein [Pelagibacterium limicola]